MLKSWLGTFPRWDAEVCYVDYSEGSFGNCGIFPQGVEEIDRREDVLGNVQVSCRIRFRLLRMAGQSGDGQNAAQWLLDFENWVQQQSAAGLTPRFGDVPEKEVMRAERGKRSETRQTGSGTYEVILTVEFTKNYEVIE